MPTYSLTVNLTEDGQPLPGFPVVQTQVVPESSGKQTFSRPDDPGVFTDLPLGELGDINVLYITADQPVTLRFNDQVDQGLPMNTNGIFIMFTGDIPSAALSKASLDNSSGSAAQVTMVSGGS